MAETSEESLPYVRPEKSFLELLPFRINGRLQWLLKSKLLMKIFGPSWAPLFGSNYAGQWKISVQLRALRHYLAQAARILPMNSTWGNELSKHLRIPPSKFTVCAPGTFDKATKLPKGGRFDLPLQFGHPHRVSYQAGTYFVLEAWRKSKIPRDKGVLHIYGAQGDRDLLGSTIYSDLIESGSIMVHEGRIANRLDEVFLPLAAVISGYQWKIGACGNPSATARGIPTISSRWEHTNSEKETPAREGINALLYDKWNSDSLAEVLRSCTENPTLLERLYETCEFPPGFTHKDFIERYLQVYEDVLNPKHT
jgi:glycosyltransferase involved in cell wall biosynthesis